MLQSICSQFVTDVLGQYVNLIFKNQAVQEEQLDARILFLLLFLPFFLLSPIPWWLLHSALLTSYLLATALLRAPTTLSVCHNPFLPSNYH
jgi:hypothetical protein